MKPSEMDQDKLLAWIKAYLERSAKDLENMREAFYDFVNAGLNEQAEQQLKELSVKEDVHVMLLGEVFEAEEYQKMMELMQKMSKDAPEA
jgi:predicted  nucleic acid-binding Zn-ribbon protein